MSKIGRHVVPAFVVFQTLPDAAATYQVLETTGSTAMSMMRPDISAGPMLRHLRPDSRPESSFGAASSCSSSSSCAMAGDTTDGTMGSEVETSPKIRNEYRNLRMGSALRVSAFLSRQ